MSRRKDKKIAEDLGIDIELADRLGQVMEDLRDAGIAAVLAMESAEYRTVSMNVTSGAASVAVLAGAMKQVAREIGEVEEVRSTPFGFDPGMN